MNSRKQQQKSLRALREALVVRGMEAATVLCDARVSHDRWQVAADPLIRVFFAHGAAVPLLRRFLDADVASAPDAAALFRANSPATRMMGALFRAAGGGEYLRPLLFPCVTEVLSGGESADWDAAPGEQRAMELTRSTLLRVFESHARCPLVLRTLFRHVRDAAGARFPQARLVSVGSFFFLRFLSPALASPDAFGVSDEAVRPRAKRGLVLVSSAVQKLANGALGSPVERLPGAADTAARFFPLLLDFLERLCDVPAAEDNDAAFSSDEPAFPVDDDLLVLQDVLVKSLPDVLAALAERFPQYNAQPLRDALASSRVQQSLHSKQPSMAAAPMSPASLPMPRPTQDSPPSIPTAVAKAAAEPVDTVTLAFDAHRDVQKCLGELVKKTEKMYHAMSARLEAEMAARRKAEEECRVLRAELDLLHRRYAVDAHAIVPVAASVDASMLSSSPSSPGASSASTALASVSASTGDQRQSEVMRKRELLKTIGEVHEALDDLRRRVDNPSDINDAVFVGKVVRELHTLVQLPLGKRGPEPKPIPRQFDVAGITWDKTKPLRVATAKALDEIKAHLDSIFQELGPLLHLVDLEQRVFDTRALLQLGGKP